MLNLPLLFVGAFVGCPLHCNGKPALRQYFLFQSILIGESGHIGTIIIHYLFFFTPLLTSLTPLSISFSQFSFSSISPEAPTPPCTIWCAIIHLERAILSLNGIIIGPALLLIAKVTIACMCIWVKVCVSLSASDTSVAAWMSMDRCAQWSRTAWACWDLDINEIVTKLTLSN